MRVDVFFWPRVCFLYEVLPDFAMPLYQATSEVYGIIGTQVRQLQVTDGRVHVPMASYNDIQFDALALDLLNFVAKLQPKVPLSKVPDEYTRRGFTDWYRVQGAPHLRVTLPEIVGIRPTRPPTYNPFFGQITGNETRGLALMNTQAVFEVFDPNKACPCGINPLDCTYHGVG